MAIQCDPLLTDEQYNEYRYYIILGLEESGTPNLVPYTDNPDGGYATIGAGFRMDVNLKEILKTFGFDTTTDASVAEKEYIARIEALIGKNKIFTNSQMITLRSQLNAIMLERYNYYNTNFSDGTKRQTFEFTDEAEVKVAFQEIIYKYENQLTTLFGETSQFSIVPRSYERMALLSRIYNSGTLNSGLRNAFLNGDRAEAWYWLRYSGYTSQGQELSGLVKRRFTEAELFGLYNDSGGNTVYLDEAKQIYQMFTRHRDDIKEKEAKYGISFDGIRGTQLDNNGRTALEAANQDYQSIISAYLTDGTVDTLQQNLELAKWSILSDLRSRYGEFASKLQDSAIKSTNIYMNPSNIMPGLLDARQYETTSAGENDVMIGNDSRDTILGGAGNDILIGEGGDDTIRGGKGNDILNGGEGVDTYYYRAGDGSDWINDTGTNNVIIEKADGTKQKITNLYETGDNVWTTADGKIEITHHSPWQIVLEDGSTLTLGENLQDGDFGIHLQDVPENPTTTHEIIEDNWSHEPFLGGIIDTANRHLLVV